jgi:hypothetical protein
MRTNREFRTRVGVLSLLALGTFLAALALAPTASARVNVGFSVNIALPPGVHVSVGNYDPYYVGRVFYQPLGVWRPVYSFPVATPYGVLWTPYVYDGGRVVCQRYIPGPEFGYGQFIIEGRGHYNPAWRRPVAVARGHANYGGDHGWDKHRHGNRGRDDRSHDRGDSRGNGNHRSRGRR